MRTWIQSALPIIKIQPSMCAHLGPHFASAQPTLGQQSSPTKMRD